MKKIIVGITGASGVIYGVRILEVRHAEWALTPACPAYVPHCGTSRGQVKRCTSACRP